MSIFAGILASISSHWWLRLTSTSQNYLLGNLSLVFFCFVFLRPLLYVANLLPFSIHSHIQGPILAEWEASLCLIHLHGGASSIQQDSINAAWLNVHVWQQGFKLAESAKQWFHTTTEERMEEKDMNKEIPYLYNFIFVLPLISWIDFKAINWLASY